MSEQTPNSPEGFGGGEPSMEDILASIRKIISDDEPMAMESPEDAPVADLVESSGTDGLEDVTQEIHSDFNDLTSDAILDAEDIDDMSFSAEGDSVDLNIDDVLAGLDEDILSADAGVTSLAELDTHISDDSLTAIDDVLDTSSLSADALEPAVDTSFISSDVSVDAGDDILSLLDEDIPLVTESSAKITDIVPVGAALAVPALVAAKMAAPEDGEVLLSNDDEMDSLLDDILMTPSKTELETNDTPLSDMSFQPEDVTHNEHEDVTHNEFDELESAANLFEPEEMSDLDLVKSLMADLADEPAEYEADEDLEALLTIPEVEGEAEVDELVSSFTDESAEDLTSEAEPQDDILGDILDMSLEDELQSHPGDIEMSDDFTSLDDVLGAEHDNIAENALLVEDLPTETSLDDDFPSLSEIAAAAEADAVAVETAIAPQAAVATASLTAAFGGAALGVATLAKDETETQIETEAEFEFTAEPETSETYSETTTETFSSTKINTTQETSMPVQAVKTDAILDDVTQTATAGAFAKLNQVVEDKAIFNERGPRIGDLVQDALRPMLKEWLDANLKGIVERAVAKEVKRISSGK